MIEKNLGWVGFQKSYVIFRVGHDKWLRLLTRWVGGVKKGQKYAYVILEWSLMKKMRTSGYEIIWFLADSLNTEAKLVANFRKKKCKLSFHLSNLYLDFSTSIKMLFKILYTTLLQLVRSIECVNASTPINSIWTAQESNQTQTTIWSISVNLK